MIGYCFAVLCKYLIPGSNSSQPYQNTEKSHLNIPGVTFLFMYKYLKKLRTKSFLRFKDVSLPWDGYSAYLPVLLLLRDILQLNFVFHLGRFRSRTIRTTLLW